MNKYKALISSAALALLPTHAVFAADDDMVFKVGFTPASAFLPLYAADAQGFFEKRGLSVELQLTPVGSTIPAALLSESLTVGTLTPSIFLLGNAGGLDLDIIAAASFLSSAKTTAGAASSADTPLSAPEDFVGKRVAAPGLNSIQHVLFQKWLGEAGVDPRDVSFVEAPFPQMGDMLKGGTVDAALMVEPFLSRAQASGVAAAPVVFAPEERTLEAFYAISARVAEAHPDSVALFREAIVEGTEWVAANEDAARTLQTTYLKLPEEVAATVPLPEFGAEIAASDLDWWIASMQAQGILEEGFTSDGMIVE
ncbi:MAG: ABC transporter substrate-binding protein [Pseudomonadota bacterium]|nr:ABC transporter substrate-binding protein [Pseudomonadota bacterium]